MSHNNIQRDAKKNKSVNYNGMSPICLWHII